MKRSPVYAFGWLMTVALALLVSVPARSQTPPKTCCSNYRVYAGSLLGELSALCAKKPDKMADVHKIVGDFITEAGKRPSVNLSEECRYIDPVLQVADQRYVLHGCYDPRYLLKIYAQHYNRGAVLCAAPDNPIEVPTPCDPEKPQNGCGETIAIWPVMYLPSAGSGTVINHNSFVYNLDIEVELGQDDRSKKPVSPEAPEPLQPQVPTDSVFGTQVGLLRPSDTRMTSMQLPFVVTENGTYGTAGVAFSPYKIYQLESDTGDDIGALEKVPLLGVFLKRMNVSLGATRNPGQMGTSASTDGAVALSFQHANDHDPLLNSSLAECLKAKVKNIKDEMTKACANEEDKEMCQLQQAPKHKEAARQGFRDCLRQHAKSAAASVIGTSSELTRFWYTYEGSLDWYLSGLAYGGMQYNHNRGVFVPVEAGGQVSLTTPSFSSHADFSMMLGSDSGSLKLRPSGGLGVSVAAFAGMTANFGVRFMPVPWEEDWSWNRATDLMEKRYIVGVGWAGNDSASLFYRQILEDKTSSRP
ncbi:MAG: hypothetical protein BWY14_00048 [Parcubacteria group bacterium ADurb.Bin192]|nr:MAG: hypothetical protein BWY14_00048 [Parcubacteria group bacterium ADurb.Bin192]